MRFPEFSGEWNISHIGNEFHLYSGNTPSRLDKRQFEGCVNWITSGELKEHYIADTKETISEAAASNNNLKLLPIGTFVIAIYGLEAYGVRGTGSITTKESTISQACMAFLTKGNIENEFLYSWYKKHGQIIGLKYAQGTKQQNLSYDILANFRIAFPSNTEQAKLVRFISLIDKRIATQNKIIEKLKTLIKGIYSVVFQGTFNKECYRLGDISVLYQPTTISSADLNDDDKYIVYGANGIIGRYNKYNHELPQITITCRGNTCGTANYTSGYCWITGNSMVVNTEKFTTIVNQRYLFHYLNYIDFSGIISGSGQPQIVRSPLEKLKIFLPILSEQQKISTNIDSILAKFSLEQSVLSYLQQQKKFLLQQMFI